jgi:hypothetical protein
VWGPVGLSMMIASPLAAAAPDAVDAAPSPQRVMPSPLWRGAARIGLMCDTGIAPALCEVIADEARRRSLLPVTPIPSDHRATKADRDTVIVAVAIEQHPQGEHLVVAVRRAVEIDDAESPARYSVAWHGTAPPRPQIDDVLQKSLPHHRNAGNRPE